MKHQTEKGNIQIIDPPPLSPEMRDQIFQAQMTCWVPINPFGTGFFVSIPGSGFSYINNTQQFGYDSHLKPLANAVRRSATKGET